MTSRPATNLDKKFYLKQHYDPSSLSVNRIPNVDGSNKVEYSKIMVKNHWNRNIQHRIRQKLLEKCQQRVPVNNSIEKAYNLV